VTRSWKKTRSDRLSRGLQVFRYCASCSRQAARQAMPSKTAMPASSFYRTAQSMSHATRGNRSSPPIPLFEGALTAIQHNAKKLCATAASCLLMLVCSRCPPLRGRIISAILNGRQPFGLSRCGASRHVVRSPPAAPRRAAAARAAGLRGALRRSGFPPEEKEKTKSKSPSFEVVVLACPSQPSTVLGGSRAAALEPLTHLRAVLRRQGKQPQQEQKP
jgi:hypothetical protein